MGSGAIIGAAIGCGSALLLILTFIIFRYKLKRNEVTCWGFFSQQKHEFGAKNKSQSDAQKSPTTSSTVYSFSGATKSSLLLPKLSPIQPDALSSSSGFGGFNCESPYPSQTLFPSDYQRKLSTSTGYSSHSSDTYRSFEDVQELRITLHYRCYYDLDNAQLILHIVDARLSASSTGAENNNSSNGLLQPSSSPERAKQQSSSSSPHRDTYVTFYLTAANGERRCGQTKITRTSSAMAAEYDEIFAFPASYDTVTEQRLHFDVLCYNSYSRPQSLGSAEVTLDGSSLNNQDLWTDMIPSCYSPLVDSRLMGVRDNHNGRSEILVFLSFCIPREELTVNLLKAKNLAGLFPIYIQEETDIYVKTCLIADASKLKRRTGTQAFTHTSNPTLAFNESLNYSIKYPQLEACVLLIYIVQRRREPKREKTVGKCVIQFGGSASASYLQWTQQGNAQVIRSNAAWHTIVRYHHGSSDGAARSSDGGAARAAS
ncbi:hypothetical protein BV898_12308 [Hypsibius exemplaris]|uniref:C2 domain-containing protein n=1 Tax=Hypsibius exemplaris TaxID=2072580 RepID=A0A1W0WE16_HYPEX|nr:hypothetical protein BV898_12308 [Hypsibius exemplaris]